MNISDETPYFDVPFCGIDDGIVQDYLWSTQEKQNTTTQGLRPNHKHFSKIRKRVKYTNNLAKQLENIGVQIDQGTGAEVFPSSISDCTLSVSSDIEADSKLFHQSIADDTLSAISYSSIKMSSNNNEDILDDWNPMKTSYEQKHFNTYNIQKFDDNPREKHAFVKNKDGIETFSPTKSGSDGVRLYIGNIPLSMTEDGLYNLLSTAGKCFNVRKCHPKSSDMNSTFGFATFEHVKEAEAAIAKFNGFFLGGNYKLFVKLALNGRQHGDNHGGNHEQIMWGGNEMKLSDNIDGVMNGNVEISKPSPVAGNTLLETPSDIVLSQPLPENKHRLYIQGVSVKTSPEELCSLFGQVGKAFDCVIVTAKKTNQRTTYGFISYNTAAECDEAIKRFHNYQMSKNYTIQVSYSVKTVKSKTPLLRNEDESFYDNLYTSPVLSDIDSPPDVVSPFDSKQKTNALAVLKENNKMTPPCSDVLLGVKTVNDIPKMDLPTAEDFEVCFTEVVSPHLMYGQLLCDETATMLDEVTMLCELYHDAKDAVCFTPNVHEICCVKFDDDGCWYRASVLDCNNTSAKVFFIDYGNEANVDMLNIRHISKELLQFPKLTHAFSLTGVETVDGVWKEAAVNYIRESVVEKRCSVKAFKVNDGVVLCDVLLTDGALLSSQLVEKDFVLEQRLLISQMPRLKLTKSSYDCIVVSVSSPTSFFAWVGDMLQIQKTVASMTEQLVVDHVSTSYKPVMGEVCSAYHTEYNEWYRVSVINLAATTATVQLIDYGNAFDVSFKHISPLRKFVQTPVQCIEMSLAGIDVKQHWSDEALKFISEKLEFQKSYINKIDDVNGKWVVDILIGDEDFGKTFRERFHQPRVNRYTKDSVGFFMPSEKHFDVLITHVLNPHLFYGRIADLALNEKVAKMSVDMMNVFSLPSEVTYHPAKNDICAGFHVDYGEWYRVMIQNVIDENEVEVFLFDFGDTCVMMVKDLRPLPEEFSTLPGQAIPFSLRDIQPVDMIGCWSEDVVLMFSNMVLFQKVALDCHLIAESTLHVTAHNGKDDIGTLLVEEGLARLKGDVHSKTTAYLVTTMKNENRFMYPQFPAKVYPAETFELIIVNVESPCCFHGQIADVELLKEIDDICTKMTSELMDDYSSYQVVVGEVCAAFFPAYEQFFRVVVDDIQDSDINVTSIDYGNKQVVKSADIKPLPKAYAVLPGQAFHLSLFGANPLKKLSVECTKYFMENCINRKVYVYIKEREGEVCHVTMSTDTIPSFLALLKNKAFLVDDEESGADICTNIPEMKLSKKFKTMMSHIETLDFFYMQVCEREILSRCYDMHVKLDELCDKTCKTYVPAIDEICCGRFEGAWYRVKVETIKDNKSAVVYFIDYGNRDDVEFSSLRSLPEEFVNTPAFAVQMKLCNPTGLVYTEEMLEEFKRRTEAKMTAVVVVGDCNGVLEVDVLDEHDQSVAESLRLIAAKKKCDGKLKTLNESDNVQREAFQLKNEAKPADTNVQSIEGIQSRETKPVETKPQSSDTKTSSKPTEKPKTISQPKGDDEIVTQSPDAKTSPKPTEKPKTISQPKGDDAIVTQSPDAKTSSKPAEKPKTISQPKGDNEIVTQSSDTKTSPKPTEKPKIISQPKGDDAIVTQSPDAKTSSKPAEKPKTISQPKGDDEIVTQSPDAKTSPKPTEKPKTVYKVEKEEKETVFKSTREEIPIVSSTEVHEQLMVDNDSQNDSKRSPSMKPHFTVSKLPDYSHPLESIQLKMSIARLSLSKEAVQVYVTHVESPHLMYCVKADTEDLLAPVSMEMEAWWEENESEHHTKAGALCSVQDQSGVWCRGVVTCVTEEYVTVFCMDRGFSINVQHNLVKDLPGKYRELAAQVLAVKLFTVKALNGEWSKDDVDAVKKIVDGEQIKLMCVQREGVVTNVRMKLLSTDETIASLMEKKGLVTIITPSPAKEETACYSPRKGVPFDEIQRKFHLEAFPQGREIECIVTCAVSPRLFYAQIYDEEKILAVDEMGAKLSAMYDDVEGELQELNDGDVCAVKYQDELWYRGYVIEARTDTSIVVYLIDYGVREVVSLHRLRQLPESMLDYPAQAICMQLQIVPPFGSPIYSKEAIQSFKSLTLGRLMKVRVVVHGNCRRVIMHDALNKNDLANQMVKLGYAEPYPEHYNMKTPRRRSPSGGVSLRDLRRDVQRRETVVNCASRNQRYQQHQGYHGYDHDKLYYGYQGGPRDRDRFTYGNRQFGGYALRYPEEGFYERDRFYHKSSRPQNSFYGQRRGRGRGEPSAW